MKKDIFKTNEDFTHSIFQFKKNLQHIISSFSSTIYVFKFYTRKKKADLKRKKGRFETSYL